MVNVEVTKFHEHHVQPTLTGDVTSQACKIEVHVSISLERVFHQLRSAEMNWTI